MIFDLLRNCLCRSEEPRKAHHAVIPRQRNRAAACCFSALFVFLFCGTLRWPRLHPATTIGSPEDEDLQIDRLKNYTGISSAECSFFSSKQRQCFVNIPLPTAVTAGQAGQSNGYRDVFGAIPIDTAELPLVSTNPLV